MDRLRRERQCEKGSKMGVICDPTADAREGGDDDDDLYDSDNDNDDTF